MGSAGATASHFTASRERFDTVLAFLDGAAAATLSHAELEDRLEIEGRQLVRQLFQDHLELRALREIRVEVVAADGVSRLPVALITPDSKQAAVAAKFRAWARHAGPTTSLKDCATSPGTGTCHCLARYRLAPLAQGAVSASTARSPPGHRIPCPAFAAILTLPTKAPCPSAPPPADRPGLIPAFAPTTLTWTWPGDKHRCLDGRLPARGCQPADSQHR